MMNNGSRWVLGGCMAFLCLLGLFIASRGGDTSLYWAGLLLFAIGVFTIFQLIRRSYDAAEGREPTEREPRKIQIVPWALTGVAVGSVVFHLASPWWWAPIASNWQYIDDTINLTFWLTGIAFVVIALFMAWCTHRYRHRAGNKAEYEPESKRLEWALTIGTAVAVAAMLAPGLFVWNQFVDVPEDATEIEVVGQQWYWSYRLPGEDGLLGTSDTRNISAANPLGLNPNDPNGLDDVIVQSGALHLPIDQPVKVWLRSTDVLHSFYVPEFRAKMDLVPGMVTHLWFTPTRTGDYQILCAELCGVAHALMRGEVTIVEEGDYLAWLQDQQTFAHMLAAAQPTTQPILVSGGGEAQP